MPTYTIQHITEYNYDAPIIDSVNMIKVYPYQSDDQNVINQEVFISHDPIISFFIDYWGNRVGVFSITEPHQTIKIDSRIKIHKEAPSIKLMKAIPKIIKLDYTLPEVIESQEIILKIIQDAPLKEHKRVIVEWCNQYVYHNFKYEKGITDAYTTLDDILKLGKGVCQDLAHVLIQMLRTLGITCRYVSGYICPNKNGMRGQGATHAWVEVWLDEYGWFGIDPTNNMWVLDTHIKLSSGRNFKDCSPMKGTFKGIANQSLSVYVSVGYEDGHVIEDTNDVVMHQERVLVPAIIPKKYYEQ
ncbi:MAG: transglutaminase family protein [Flavobacteriales bacterium]|nr:transglutaminase family protein [Flavobacteriales bacterium]